MSKIDFLVLRELVVFANMNGVNKSKISRKLGVSRKTVHTVINKYKG
jgi:transposase